MDIDCQSTTYRFQCLQHLQSVSISSDNHREVHLTSPSVLSVQAFKGHQVRTTVDYFSIYGFTVRIGPSDARFCYYDGEAPHVLAVMPSYKRAPQWTVSVFYGVDMAIDSTLTGTLIVYLLRNRTGTQRRANILVSKVFRESDDNAVPRNDSMIQTLIVYTINTGDYTSY